MIFCDRCGKRIEKTEYYETIEERYQELPSWIKCLYPILCEECIDEIENMTSAELNDEINKYIENKLDEKAQSIKESLKSIKPQDIDVYLNILNCDSQCIFCPFYFSTHKREYNFSLVTCLHPIYLTKEHPLWISNLTECPLPSELINKMKAKVEEIKNELIKMKEIEQIKK
jgi:hypothetical protein